MLQYVVMIGHLASATTPGFGAYKVTFHKFSMNNAALLKNWSVNISRKVCMFTAHHILYSKHFSDDCFDIQWKVHYMQAQK